MDAEVARGHHGAKLSFTRVSLNYFLSEAVFRYVVDAVHLLADEGWKLLPLYRFDLETGLWRHRERPARPSLSLDDVSFAEPGLGLGRPPAAAPESVLPGYLDEARRILRDAANAAAAAGSRESPVSAEFERIRWFPLPGEALAQLRAT